MEIEESIDEIISKLKIQAETTDESETAKINEERAARFISAVSQNIEKYLSRAEVPKRYLNPKTNCAGMDFNKSYYLYGPVGTGKTDRAVCLLKNIILNAKPVKEFNIFKLYENLALFASVPSMLLNIRSAFKNDAVDESKLIKKYITPKVLILDDLGTEKTTEWVTQTLYIIINGRYEDEKQTIITSNLNLDDVKEVFSDKIASRISAMADVVEIKGTDRRKAAITVIK